MALLVPAVFSGQTVNTRGKRSASPKSTISSVDHNNLAGTFHGTLKELTGKEIVIETGENQTVTIRRNRKTRFLKDAREIKASEITLDTPVSVEAAEDIDLKPIAITVTADSAAKKSSGK